MLLLYVASFGQQEIEQKLTDDVKVDKFLCIRVEL